MYFNFELLPACGGVCTIPSNKEKEGGGAEV